MIIRKVVWVKLQGKHLFNSSRLVDWLLVRSWWGIPFSIINKQAMTRRLSWEAHVLIFSRNLILLTTVTIPEIPRSLVNSPTRVRRNKKELQFWEPWRRQCERGGLIVWDLHWMMKKKKKKQDNDCAKPNTQERLLPPGPVLRSTKVAFRHEE